MNNIVVMVPLTHKPENTYHQNMVLNQCASTDMSQSHEEVEEVTAKNTMKIAETVMLFL